MSRKEGSNADVKLLKYLLELYSRTSKGYVSSREVFKGTSIFNKKKGKMVSQALSEEYGVSNGYAVGVLISGGIFAPEITEGETVKRSPNVKWDTVFPNMEMVTALKKHLNETYPPKPKVNNELPVEEVAAPFTTEIVAEETVLTVEQKLDLAIAKIDKLYELVLAHV
jgi:hypothetical protein